MKVVSVVGWHNAGKTTVIERLVSALKSLGLRVATIKHTREEIRMDAPGTDTWRFAEAGSDLVIIAGAKQTIVLERRAKEETLEELLRRVPADTDLVITEGYKKAQTPKIEVRRAEIGGEPIAPFEELIAIVSDEQNVETKGVPLLSFEDVAGLVHVLQRRGLIKGQ